jgi:hypothetical protein
MKDKARVSWKKERNGSVRDTIAQLRSERVNNVTIHLQFHNDNLLKLAKTVSWLHMNPSWTFAEISCFCTNGQMKNNAAWSDAVDTLSEMQHPRVSLDEVTNYVAPEPEGSSPHSQQPDVYIYYL